MRSRILSSQHSSILIWLVCCALLLSQLSGFSHRITHFTSITGGTWTLANKLAQHESARIQLAANQDINSHSCLLIEAASLCEPVPFFTPTIAHFKLSFFLTSHFSFIIWQASPSPFFYSRAPPF